MTFFDHIKVENNRKCPALHGHDSWGHYTKCAFEKFALYLNFFNNEKDDISGIFHQVNFTRGRLFKYDLCRNRLQAICYKEIGTF